MSVTTAADEAIESARRDIKSAIKSLHTAIDPDTWGSEDYSNERDEEILELYKILLDVRKKL